MPRKRRDYKSGVDEEKIIAALRQKAQSPRQLLRSLGLPASRRRGVSDGLQTLLATGRIVQGRGGVYSLSKPARKLTGRIQQTQPGFAFLIPNDEGEADCYISGPDLGDALPDDVVEARLIFQGKRPGQPGSRRRAQVLRVVRRARATLVGKLRKWQKRYWLQPEGVPGIGDFMLPDGLPAGGQAGDKAVVRVTGWPEGMRPGQAEVIEVLGSEQDPGVAITALIRRHELPDRFTKTAREEARCLAREPGPDALAGRLDLRQDVIVTIDGADARDFDDAVSCRAEDNGWRLGVHIADVSHYLASGTPLDLEVRERGTSVYLPDRVLHMLPEPLSCGVCSLVPDQDRLTLSAFMHVSPDGLVTKTEFHRSVIHSNARLTYEGVEKVLSSQDAGEDAAGRFVPELKQLHEVAQALRGRRNTRGSLDFDLPDPRVVLGPDGRVQTIEKRESLQSHRLIEDCMIAANEAVARFLLRLNMPTLYRVHEPPEGEKFESFREFLAVYGYRVEKGKPKNASRAFQKLLQAWEGKPEAPVLNMALLRAMKMAVYAPTNLGHFGLASDCYTHFTSPIRRYPDLIVHRMLTERLGTGILSGARRNRLQAQMERWGEDLSQLERRAEKIEREAVKMKQMEFMAGKIGETFAGVITHVTNFGFFVELAEPFVEGLVRAADLADDYYMFDEHRYELQGTNHGRTFSLGLAVSVQVAGVEREKNRVIFALRDPAGPGTTGPQRNTPRAVKRARRKRL